VTFEIEKSIKRQVFKEVGFQTIEGKIFTINSKKSKNKVLRKLDFTQDKVNLGTKF
jgi:hypothetical protein